MLLPKIRMKAEVFFTSLKTFTPLFIHCTENNSAEKMQAQKINRYFEKYM